MLSILMLCLSMLSACGPPGSGEARQVDAAEFREDGFLSLLLVEGNQPVGMFGCIDDGTPLISAFIRKEGIRPPDSEEVLAANHALNQAGLVLYLDDQPVEATLLSVSARRPSGFTDSDPSAPVEYVLRGTAQPELYSILAGSTWLELGSPGQSVVAEFSAAALREVAENCQALLQRFQPQPLLPAQKLPEQRSADPATDDRATTSTSGMADSTGLAGIWQGSYREGQSMVPFELNLTADGHRFFGTCTEPDLTGQGLGTLTADIRGEVRGSVVEFFKTYRLDLGVPDAIHYRGGLTPDGLAVNGEWTVGDRRGAFRMEAFTLAH